MLFSHMLTYIRLICETSGVTGCWPEKECELRALGVDLTFETKKHLPYSPQLMGITKVIINNSVGNKKKTDFMAIHPTVVKIFQSRPTE